jgi:hypothetical protein
MNKIYTVDNTIYKEEYITSAIDSFWEIANISYEKWIITIISDDNEGADMIFSELMNFIIWLINE